MRNEPHNKRPLKPDTSKRLRLLVEKLESRRLLAGVNVSVTIDAMATDWAGQSNQAAAGRIVYIDLDHNGQPDANDPVAITNELGRAFFEGLAAGDYSVGLLTDNISQRQVYPSFIQEVEVRDVPVNSHWLIGDTSTSLWGLSSDGILTLIQGNSESRPGSNNSILELGGEPTSVVQKSPNEAWISYKNGSQAGLAIFNTSSRQITNYYISNVAMLSDLASDGNLVYGVLTSIEGNRLVSLSPVSNLMNVNTLASGSFQFVESVGNRLFTAQRSGTDTLIQLRDKLGVLISSRTVSGVVLDLKADLASSAVAVETNTGVIVLRATESSLNKVAIIADATGPLEFGAGRLIASDRSEVGKVTIWSMDDWMPLSHHDIGSEMIRDLAFVPQTLQLLALTGDHLTILDSFAPQEAIVALRGQEIADVEFAVQQLKQANPPSVPANLSESTLENQSKQVDLRQRIIDANEQTLWYSVLTGPQHGQVQLDVNGQMIYSPGADFFGQDSLIIRVYDGQASADVLIHWDVIEVNQAPTAILVNASTVSESLPAGSVIGTVSVVDPNLNDTYRITTSDYRFSVVDGKLILNESLDYEAASTIPLDLSAVDSAGQFNISSKTTINVSNVIEAPSGAVLSELSISENRSNVSVGKLFVISPDAEGVYEVTVDDPRFEVQGDDLFLIEPLNFEQASNVSLKLTVTDKAHPGKQATSSVKIEVNDEDDPPTQIILTTLEVEEKTPGAAVGQISVADEDGDSYQFYVSDNRFQVVDGILRLAENVSLDRTAELNIPLTITALASRGARLIGNFPLSVIQPRSPWQNPNNPIDVNNDGIVTPRDALAVINFLNENPPGSAPPLPSSGGEGGGVVEFPDVNGDGIITPRDALMIINALNARSANMRAGGEGEASMDQFSSVGMQAWTSDEDIRRKNNSKIDAELERILDQLAGDSQRT